MNEAINDAGTRRNHWVSHIARHAHAKPGAVYLRAADKIVYSRSLESVSTARTRLERNFDPESVRQLKTRAARDITVGGAALAAQAIKAGLVEECHLIVNPVVVGGQGPR